jgi:hypothetical protein
MDLFPVGWTLEHLEHWFRCAIALAEKSTEERPDLPRGSDKSPSWAPSPRGLVTHAHLIVRHLGLPGSPAEARGQMDRAGCLADLRDVLAFFRRALSNPQQTPRVVLRDRTEGPVVLGKPKRKLTTAQYDVVKALLDAGETGLTKDKLVSNSRHEDARGVLKRLAKKDDDWQQVIDFAGETGGGYRLK